MDGCNDHAYAVCKTKLYPLFICCCFGSHEGCKKDLCKKHIQLWYEEHGIPVALNCKLALGDIGENGEKLK